MTISYPLTPPSTPKPQRVEWLQMTACEISQSPFSGHQQVVEWDAGLWGVRVSYPPMRRAAAAPLIAFLMSLRGSRGTFYMAPTQFSAPLGTGGGTPKVNGASQVGYGLVTDGWSNSSLVLKAGDFFQVNSQLYVNLTDATSDGSGNATLDIWPNARNHADNASIVVSSPKCVMRLASQDLAPFEEVTDRWYSISFAAQEAK